MLAAYSPKTRSLIRRLKTPEQVQRWIHSLKYNATESMHTIDWVVQHKKAHCLEAAMAAAVILEYHGYPPLILDLESADRLDHTLFVFRRKGKYGAIAMSRDVGLFGRRPVYRNIRALVQSYAAPYIDARAKIVGYGLLDLRQLPRHDWRTSKRSVWYVEDALNDNHHHSWHSPARFVHYWRHRALRHTLEHPSQPPAYYPHQENWM